MINQEQLFKDYEILDIKKEDKITVKFVTIKYKRKARIVHPDKVDGSKEEFQELLNAYRRIIKHLDSLREEGEMEQEDDHERNFFMKHNLMKECSSSIVVYIENDLVEKWKKVLTRHLSFQNMDKCRVIFKSSLITVTLYAKPKKDPRSKIHIQGGNQKANLDFVMDTMASFYQEVCKLMDNLAVPHNIKTVQRAICGKCVKQHILRMHVNKARNLKNDEEVTLEEAPAVEVIHPTINTHDNIISVEFTPKASPANKKMRVEANTEVEKEGQEIIKSLLKDLQDSAVEHSDDKGNNVDNNFQCGECGKCFVNQSLVEQHIKEEHTLDNDVIKQLDVAKDQIEKLKDKIEVLIKANESQQKENNLHKLALAESMFELEESKKEVRDKNEVVNEKVKQNTLLKEEIKVKDKIIENLKAEQTSEQTNERQTSTHTSGANVFQCNQCDFKTKKSHLLNGHKIAHTGGFHTFCYPTNLRELGMKIK